MDNLFEIDARSSKKIRFIFMTWQCHWNLNSITEHNYLKVSLLRAWVAIKKFNVVCLSETYLNSSNLSDDDNFYLPSYNLVEADHPSNAKKGGVCIYF